MRVSSTLKKMRSASLLVRRHDRQTRKTAENSESASTNSVSEQNAHSLAGLYDVTIHGSPDHRRVIETDDHDFLAKVAAKKFCSRLSC
jgi:hypothetical protein